MNKKIFLAIFFNLGLGFFMKSEVWAGTVDHHLKEEVSDKQVQSQYMMNKICKFLYNSHTSQSNVTTNYSETEKSQPFSLNIPKITLGSKPISTKAQDLYYYYKILNETGNILIYIPSSMIARFNNYIALYEVLENNEGLHFENFVMADPATFHTIDNRGVKNTVKYLAFVNVDAGSVIFAGPEENVRENIFNSGKIK